jgi:hypothetical protein
VPLERSKEAGESVRRSQKPEKQEANWEDLVPPKPEEGVFLGQSHQLL